MSDTFLPDRVRDLAGDIRRIDGDVARIERQKAGHEDVKAAANKADGVETEMRQKFRNVHSELQSVADQLSRLLATVEQMRDDIDGLGDTVRRTRKDVRAAPREEHLAGDWLARAPKWAWFLMGAGALAILASGADSAGKFLANMVGG